MRDINSLNKVLLIGHLGRNPELRYIPQTERAVANFNLATNERYFNPNTNESDIRAEWHRIVAWGKLAEFCEKYLAQGKQVLIEGKLRTRSWQDRDGNKKYTTEVHAQNIVLLGKKEDIGDERPFASSTSSSDFTEEDQSPSLDDGGDDEVPF
ncbi:MAG: single-stranded DNA-binding protein [Candidatus Aminicenantes bacterium]|jgi:single-strand DNA-binding protein